MANKKKTQVNQKQQLNQKPHRKQSKPRHKGSKSIITNIYTYSKRKPKRLGKTCVHFNPNKLTCKRNNSFCVDADNCTYYATNLKEIHSNSKSRVIKKDNSIVGITTIVLNDNRKCTNEKHEIIDLDAIIRIVQPNGEVSTCSIPAAYCKECDTYFVLKKDYKIVKSSSKILCPIIDMTKDAKQKYKGKNLASSESRIHQLGYNVQRGSNYTKEQRQLILANIIENTNISKHEIESCITRPMMQHKIQPNYAEAVLAWQQDLEFIKNYKTGDIPEVIIDKIIVGKRK